MNMKKFLSLHITFISIIILCIASLSFSKLAHTSVIEKNETSLSDYKNTQSVNTDNSQKLFSYYLRALHAEKITTSYLQLNFSRSHWRLTALI